MDLVFHPQNWPICHSGLDPESSHFNSSWTPALAPDPDPGFAGVTGIETFYDFVKIIILFALASHARHRPPEPDSGEAGGFA